MKLIRPLSLVVCLLLCTPAAWSTPECDDFLKLAKRKPSQLEFVGCKQDRHHQLRALVATYRVPGAHARSVESYISQRTKMAKLRFVCCGWEPDPRASTHGRQRLGQLPIRLGEGNEVTMYSTETVMNKRSRWKDIEWFYVYVTVFLDSP
ncbi:MAG: DUF4952 domain-containing protein [Casimicrobium sp.]